MSELKSVVTGIDTYKAPEKKKEDHLKDYIKSLAAIDEAIQPYKEQKTDLKKSYADNNYLSRSEQKLAIKAYRLLKDKTDFAQLDQFFEKIKDMKIVSED